LTFLISWGAAVVNALWEANFDLRASRLSIGLFVGTMVAVLLFGGARLAFALPTAPTVQIASLASSRALSDSFASARVELGSATLAERAAVREKYLQPMLDDLFTRTEEVARGGAKIVAWAEAAAFVLKEDEAEVIDRGQQIARAEGIYLQMALIPILQTEQFPYVENRAVLIDPAGEVVWRYDKSKPVPGDGHLAGPGIIPMVETPYGRLATIICFDADFPSLVRQVGQAGVDLLLVPASDWEAVSEMHSRIATFRALENGVNLIRPTRQGTSLTIDYQGRLLGYNADYFVADTHTLVTSVPTQGVTTLYATTGDSFAYLCVIGLVTLMLLAFRRLAQPTFAVDAPAQGFGD
jgi:apolipoprotein N-acyltransferase